MTALDLVPGEPPGWLVRAYAWAPDRDRFSVAGYEINRLCWGEPGRPGLVLVHGGGANVHWWSHVAPLFAHQYRVVALDLSGHGRSDRRDEYSIEGWAEEVIAAAATGQMAGPPVVVGHSMGGFVTAATAVRAGDDLAGAIILDSPMVKEDPEVEAARIGEAFGDPKAYPDIATAVDRFRTVPRQEHYQPHIVRHIAERSLREVDGGWGWQFDPRLFKAVSRSVAAALLPNIRCRVALLRAEHGLVTPEIGSIMYERLGRVAAVVEIAEAGHHMMLDQPLLLVTALRALLADWEHSVPYRR